jgi:hypothetical protein
MRFNAVIALGDVGRAARFINILFGAWVRP